MKTYTTIEQSRKLAEILPVESADMNDIQRKRNYMDMSDETQGKNCLFPLIIFVSSIIGLGVMIF